MGQTRAKREEAAEPVGTIARGLAMLAACASGYAVLLTAQHLVPSRLAPPSPVCQMPVQVFESGESVLGCAEGRVSALCANVHAGDLVTINGRQCHVDSGGMGPAFRMSAGLKVDVNRATAQELELLDGIGPKTAKAIVADRERNGLFGSVDDLARIHGIGPATVAKLQSVLTVEESAFREESRH